MFFAVWDFIFSRSSFKSVLPMAFTCAVQTSTGASRRANRAGLQLRWCRSPTRPPKLHTRPHRGEFVFSPQNGLTPPPKGGGSGYHLSWVVGFALLVHNWPTRLQQGGFAASLVSFSQPRPLTGHISPHRGEFGFGLLAGASKEDHPPFRQSRVSNRAEEENTPALLLKIHPG